MTKPKTTRTRPRTDHAAAIAASNENRAVLSEKIENLTEIVRGLAGNIGSLSTIPNDMVAMRSTLSAVSSEVKSLDAMLRGNGDLVGVLARVSSVEATVAKLQTSLTAAAATEVTKRGHNFVLFGVLAASIISAATALAAVLLRHG